MIEHIIDISEQPADLSFRNGLLVIQSEGQPEATIPVSEVAAVVVAHPRVTFSQTIISELALAGGFIIICDDRFMPAAMTLPLKGNFVQTERFSRQARATLPLRKRLWQQLVQAKIRAQAALLLRLHDTSIGLSKLAARVRAGDAGNIEARAARIYWRMLFAQKSFRRDADRQDQNRLLNYGYAILRAATARAICAAGLHPSLGIHHHNRYDTFCLADDLMEPFRPIVDDAVVEIVRTSGPDTTLDRDTKKVLIEALMGDLILDGESRTLFDTLSKTASSLDSVFAGTRKKLLLPEP